jgi:hypothetical protein
MCEACLKEYFTQWNSNMGLKCAVTIYLIVAFKYGILIVYCPINLRFTNSMLFETKRINEFESLENILCIYFCCLVDTVLHTEIRTERIRK